MAAGGTIVYSVDKKKINHNIYKTQILTVVPTIKPKSKDLTCKIGEYEGNAGHVLLTYPSGGMILTSMGHWKELMKILNQSQIEFMIIIVRQILEGCLKLGLISLGEEKRSITKSESMIEVRYLKQYQKVERPQQSFRACEMTLTTVVHLLEVSAGGQITTIVHKWMQSH